MFDLGCRFIFRVQQQILFRLSRSHCVFVLLFSKVILGEDHRIWSDLRDRVLHTAVVKTLITPTMVFLLIWTVVITFPHKNSITTVYDGVYSFILGAVKIK